MDIFTEFATDDDKETNGVWFNLPGGDARVLVARNKNSKYTQAAAKAFARLQKERKAGDDEAAESVLVELMARYILVGWENLSFKGDALGYSEANAITLLKVKDFQELIMGFSDNFESYRVEVEEEAGNS